MEDRENLIFWMISSLEAIFCEKFAESTEKIRKIAKQECPEAPKGWQIWQMWVTGPSNPPADLRAGAMGKTPPYLVGESPPADTGQIPCGSEKTLPMEAQIRGRFRSGLPLTSGAIPSCVPPETALAWLTSQKSDLADF